MTRKLRHLLHLALAFLVIEAVFGGHGLGEWFRGYSLHVLGALTAAAISGLIFLAGLRTEIFILSEQKQRTPDTLRRPLGLFMRSRLEDLDKVRTALYRPEGLFLSKPDLTQLVLACFDANGGKQYVGTDSSVPSEFYRRYPTYLEEHIKNKSRWGRVGFHLIAHDFRVLLVTEEELRKDHTDEPELFEAFVRGHEKHGIRLYQIDHEIAQRLAAAHQLPATDLGLFGGRFVVYFIPPSDDELLAVQSENGSDLTKTRQIPLQYKIFMESLKENNRFKLRRYLAMLNESANEIKIENNRVVCRARTDEDKREDLTQIRWITKSLREKMDALEETA